MVESALALTSTSSHEFKDFSEAIYDAPLFKEAIAKFDIPEGFVVQLDPVCIRAFLLRFEVTNFPSSGHMEVQILMRKHLAIFKVSASLEMLKTIIWIVTIMPILFRSFLSWTSIARRLSESTDLLPVARKMV
jgi:hypothetical protein